MDDLLNALRTMPKNIVLWVIEKLIEEGKIDCEDLTAINYKHYNEK